MKSLLLLPLFFALFLMGCEQQPKESTPADSIAQHIGDAMAGIDGSGGSDGGYAALVKRGQKSVARVEPAPSMIQKMGEAFLPKAEAAPCFFTNTFSSCNSNQVVRNFAGCTVGAATFTGTITFDFNDGTVDNTCTMDTNGDTISRDPNFSIAGPLGGAFTVSKTGSIGQRITRTSAGVFSFTNDGIRRVLSFNGSTLADWTASTTSAITITGATRNGRVANGGTLRVVNNLDGVSCDFSPSSVTWTSSCNCATSGSWTASCSSGESGSFVISSCGEGTLTLGSESQAVTLDQCFRFRYNSTW